MNIKPSDSVTVQAESNTEFLLAAEKIVETEECAWLRKNLGFRLSLSVPPSFSSTLYPQSTSASEQQYHTTTTTTSSNDGSIREKLQEEILWLQSYNHLSAQELRQMPVLAEQHATHLYWFRFYRRQLHDSTTEDTYILSTFQSYQEERIWLTEHSNYELLDNNKDLQERYADHYQRYQFYHESERICGDEDDFFRLNEIMKRRRQEEYETVIEDHSICEEEQVSSSISQKRGFQLYESEYSTPQQTSSIFETEIHRQVPLQTYVNQEQDDEYYRFKEMVKRRKQEETKPTLLHNQQSSSLYNAQFFQTVHLDKGQLTVKEKRNLQQQARRMAFSSDEKEYHRICKNVYDTKKREKLRSYENLLTLNNKEEINRERNVVQLIQSLPYAHSQPTYSLQLQQQHQEKQSRATMSEEEKKEKRRKQQQQNRERKKAELAAYEALMVQKDKQICNTSNQDTVVTVDIHNTNTSQPLLLQQQHQEKQSRATMSEEEKKEKRRKQQQQNRERKKAELAAYEALMAQKSKAVLNTSNQVLHEVVNREPSVLITEEQKAIYCLHQETQERKKASQQAGKRVYEAGKLMRKDRMEKAKAYLEVQEQKRIRAYHDVIKSFNSSLISSKLEIHDFVRPNPFNFDINAEPLYLSNCSNQEHIDLTIDDSNNTPATQRRLEDTRDEIVIANPYAEVSRRTLSILNGREWLNDQIINFYMHMLLQRDRSLSMETSTNSTLPVRLRSWFTTTFFFVKLLENAQYNYSNVRRWTRRDIDIFAADKVFIPINVNNNHWTLLVFFMQLKELHYYDSSNGDGSRYLQYGMRWLSDECMDKTRESLNMNEWQCFHKEPGVPQQENGYDCGVFVLMCARAIAYNQPLTSYHQDNMQRYRLMIGRDILRGSLLDSNSQSMPYMPDDLVSSTQVLPKDGISNRQSTITIGTSSQTPALNNVDTDSVDSEETLHAIISKNGIGSKDSDEDKIDHNNQTNIGCRPISFKSMSKPPMFKEKQTSILKIHISSSRDIICDDENHTTERDAAMEDQSNSCCMGIIESSAQSIRLRNNAASHKRSYWKRKQEKKHNYNDYKKGLLECIDPNLQSFQDGLQFRHRFEPLSEESKCSLCGAFFFHEEATRASGKRRIFRRCCDNGKMAFPFIQPPDEHLHNLYTGNSSEAKLFQKSIRKFNTALAFASVVSKLAEFTTKGPPVVIVQGNIQHRIGSLQKPPDKVAAYMQCYFYEEGGKDNAYFKCTNQEETILQNLRMWIKTNNRIYGQLRNNIDQINACNDTESNIYRIAFLDKVSAMPRTYNQPVCPEVALLTSSDLVSTSHSYKRSVIIPAQYNGRLQEIPYSSPHFYPLCYPLFHIYGEAGWHLNLKSLAPTNGKQDHERKVTLMDYCKYILQVRDPIFRTNKDARSPKLIKDIVLCGNGLTQQYVCDLYLAIENNNLEWIRSHQKEIKAELYCDLMEAKHKHQFSLAGRYVVLPHTHVGSPRWYYGEYQDGMARCRRFHKPDLFITFTCNPNWPEIANSMKGFEAGTFSRPDLIARVFQLKLEAMMEDLQENCIFGDVLGYMYTIEWQKRGLPHAHVLIFLTDECKFRTSADVDRVIRAEIPNPTTHPDLWELVTTNMIHGPCGKIKKDDKVRHCCILKGTCEEHFPKALGSETVMTPDSYPQYRRRSKDQGGHTFYHKECQCELDNGWIVPYNPYLLQKYGAHINVEVCTSVKAIKYLNKYVFKGSDRAQIAVTESSSSSMPDVSERKQNKTLNSKDDGKSILIDEIQQFSDCRYIGPSESCHRIFAFKLHGAKPAVIRMQVHLPDKQYVVYQEGEEEAILQDPKKPPHSQLLGYFDAVKAARLPTAKAPKLKNGLTAKDLSYHEMPEHYTYEKIKGQHIWTLRKQDMEYPTIGRMYQITPTGKNAELYHLRCLLTVRKGVGSFEELRTYNGVTYSTFKETAREMSLLKEDKEWKQCLEDYCHTMTNIEMLREKFVIIIFYNNLENPRQLWEDFKEHLSDDFRYQRTEIEGILRESSPSTQDDFDCALHQISDILRGQSFDKTLSDFNLPLPTKDREDLFALRHIEQKKLQNTEVDIIFEYKKYENMCSTMNKEQISVIKILLNELSDIKNRNTSKCYFIDAPGGTGKTYCLNAFIHYCLAKELNIIVTAYSGVAANLLLKGRTSHSQFKFPLCQDTADCTKGTLKATEALGKALYAADVIILDEGPMLHKKYWELLHNNCIDLHHRFNPHLLRTFHTPFAGKLIICSGDLRQTLPIRKYSDRTLIVQSVMNRSYLWVHFKELHLSINERVMRNALNLPHSIRSKCEQFSQQLLQLGNGAFPIYDASNNAVEISKIVHTTTTAETCLEDFVLWCYPELQHQNNDKISIYDKAILCALNEEVDAVNKIAVELMNGDQRQFYSADELDKNSDDYHDVPIEFLHSLNIGSLPPHVLDLKIGCPVILLRNINPKIGLCNGTKLIVHKFIGQYCIEFEIVSEGVHKGSIVPLPRIDFTTSETDFPFIMVRRQFPVRLAFAMSINKAQGQSLKRVGIYLKRPVFAHGQAYVALSRAGIPWETRLLIEPQLEGQGKIEYPGKQHNDSIYITANIVFKEVFSRPT